MKMKKLIPTKVAIIFIAMILLIVAILSFVPYSLKEPPSSAGVYVSTDSSDMSIYLGSQLYAETANGVDLRTKYRSISYEEAHRQGYTKHPDVSTMAVDGPPLGIVLLFWKDRNNMSYVWRHDAEPVSYSESER